MAPARWQAFIATLVGSAAVLATAFLACAFLVDPFDTGRSPLRLKEGVRPQGARTALASRGRDPHFEGAILGNSHIQLISPERLHAATGIPFVSLIAPGSGPREALATLDWFLRHHPGPAAQAVIVGIDPRWCAAGPRPQEERPFPYWLLSRSLRDYLAGLMRYDLSEEILRHLVYATSPLAERARPDGYWDYDDGRPHPERPQRQGELSQPLETGGGNSAGPFPAALELEAALRAAPGTALVLVRPPVHATALPRPGSADAAADAACREAFAALAQRRPRSVLVDGRSPRPELHDPNLFFDHGHYRQPLARLIEGEIAAALRSLPHRP